MYITKMLQDYYDTKPKKPVVLRWIQHVGSFIMAPYATATTFTALLICV